jgi:hypothetical protein
MSNVIAFLESMGRDATIKPTGSEYVAAVESLGLDDAPHQALLARDAGALGDLLGGRTKMICALFPADDDNKKDDDQEDENDVPDEKKESVGNVGLH